MFLNYWKYGIFEESLRHNLKTGIVTWISILWIQNRFLELLWFELPKFESFNGFLVWFENYFVNPCQFIHAMYSIPSCFILDPTRFMLVHLCLISKILDFDWKAISQDVGLGENETIEIVLLNQSSKMGVLEEIFLSQKLLGFGITPRSHRITHRERDSTQ